MYMLQTAGKAQWFKSLATDPEAESSIPHWASFTKARVNNPQGPLQFCSSKVKVIRRFHLGCLVAVQNAKNSSVNLILLAQDSIKSKVFFKKFLSPFFQILKLAQES